MSVTACQISGDAVCARKPSWQWESSAASLPFYTALIFLTRFSLHTTKKSLNFLYAVQKHEKLFFTR